MNDVAICRLPKACEMLGKGRSSVYKDVTAGLLTKPVAVGSNTKGWPAGELRAINLARIAGKPDGEIRELVTRLHDARLVAAEAA